MEEVKNSYNRYNICSSSDKLLLLRLAKMEDKTNDKKETDIYEIFAFPLPTWNGPKFVTSKQFLKAYRKFQCSDKGYISIDDIHNFLNVLFMDGENKQVDFHLMKNFQRDYAFYMEQKREYWISMKELLQTLPMLEDNYLKLFRGRASYTSTDYTKIWFHYDDELKGYLNKDDLAVLVFDLLTKIEQKSNPKLLQLVTDQMMQISESTDGTITFAQFRKLMPVEKNYMLQFEDISNLTDKNVDDIFAHYDPDDNGVLAGEEMYAMMRDIHVKSDQEDDICKIVENTNGFLQRVDKTGTGELSKDCLKYLAE